MNTGARLAVALAMVAALGSTQALAQSKENRTLAEAKAYTDTKVADEAKVRGDADNAEATYRSQADQDLQADVDGLTAQVGAIQAAVTSLSSPKTKTISVTGHSFTLQDPSNQRKSHGSGCYGANGFMSADLPIPAGSKILDFKARFKVINANSDLNTQLNLALFTNIPNQSLNTGRITLSNPVTVGSPTGNLDYLSNDTVYAGEAIQVVFASASSANGFNADDVAICRVSITYSEP